MEHHVANWPSQRRVHEPDLVCAQLCTQPTSASLYNHLLGRGWGENIQWKKMSVEAEQTIRYLGVEVDCEAMQYWTPQDKLVDVESVLDREITKGSRAER